MKTMTIDSLKIEIRDDCDLTDAQIARIYKEVNHAAIQDALQSILEVKEQQETIETAYNEKHLDEEFADEAYETEYRFKINELFHQFSEAHFTLIKEQNKIASYNFSLILLQELIMLTFEHDDADFRRVLEEHNYEIWQ